MKALVYCLIIVSINTAAAGEAVLPLPASAQRHIDALNVEIAKADAERQAKVDRAVEKAVKALNTLVKDTKTAQERRAIDDEILRLEKMKGDPAGDLASETSYEFLISQVCRPLYESGGKYWGELKRDGTASHHLGRTGKWVVEGGKVKVEWTNPAATNLLEVSADGVIQASSESGWKSELVRERPSK